MRAQTLQLPYSNLFFICIIPRLRAHPPPDPLANFRRPSRTSFNANPAGLMGTAGGLTSSAGGLTSSVIGLSSSGIGQTSPSVRLNQSTGPLNLAGRGLSRSMSSGGGLSGLSRSEAFLVNVDPDDLISSTSEESIPIFDDEDEDEDDDDHVLSHHEIETDV